MLYARYITVKQGCSYPTSVLEIDKIYLVGLNNERVLFDKEVVHEFVKKGLIIRVYKEPYYPKLIAVTGPKGEKYVRSEPNDTPNDNLLRLPRA
ncbi:DUF3892 domain-containing protein [Akkermansia sp.]|uniref:DUF3892 domain-containing protein n=1 Tax=Akkermansia sp. TaxID=1872421 RepID=UPI0025BE2064|nr:DUF3892 domain-containing protein [Akkermansia sp.]MCC8149337.1 DUF3892 domain-containing protein [Akkermansia sp.]